MTIMLDLLPTFGSRPTARSPCEYADSVVWFIGRKAPRNTLLSMHIRPT